MGRRIVIMAGGTGGHVYPGLAVAKELMAAGHEVDWIGTRKGLEARVVPEAGIRMHFLEVSGIRGKSLRGMLGAPWMLLKSVLEAFSLLRKLRPDVALGMGGFASGPGGLLASMMGIPLVLHEQNRVPGTTNRWLSARAGRVLEAFEGSFPEKVGALATGNPVRKEILALSGFERRNWSQPERALRIFVLGGSLGAKVLNETVPEAFALLPVSVEVRHQTGAALWAPTKARYEALGVTARVEAFIEDMAEVYRWADLVISRAGAMTVSEIAMAALPAILIPFPHAIDDHQTRNAEVLVALGAALLMPQTSLTPESLAKEIRNLVKDPRRLESMSDRAREASKPHAARDVAEICLKMAEPVS